MLVNARLSYILIDGSLNSLRGQVILTVNLKVSLHFLTDWELHLATETEQDQVNFHYYNNMTLAGNWKANTSLLKVWCPAIF
jgi:hypothetical protein